MNKKTCRRIAKVLYISFALSLVIGTLSTTVYARFLSYGWSSSTIPINNYSFNSTWQTAMDKAVFNWNNSGANIKFNKSSVSQNKIYADDYSDTWYGYGQNTAIHLFGSIIKFDVKLNSRTISRDAANFSNFVQSVFVHELGHSIYLADNPSTTSQSIMKYTRNRDTMTEPQPYDVAGVKQKYS